MHGQRNIKHICKVSKSTFKYNRKMVTVPALALSFPQKPLIESCHFLLQPHRLNVKSQI